MYTPLLENKERKESGVVLLEMYLNCDCCTLCKILYTMQYVHCIIIVNLIFGLTSYFRPTWRYQNFTYIWGQIYFLGDSQSRIYFQTLRRQAILNFQMENLISKCRWPPWSPGTLNICICAFSWIGVLQKSMYQKIPKGTTILLYHVVLFWGLLHPWPHEHFHGMHEKCIFAQIPLCVSGLAKAH